GNDRDADTAVDVGRERGEEYEGDRQNAVQRSAVGTEQVRLAPAQDKQTAHRQNVPDEGGQTGDQDRDVDGLAHPVAGNQESRRDQTGAQQRRYRGSPGSVDAT